MIKTFREVTQIMGLIAFSLSMALGSIGSVLFFFNRTLAHTAADYSLIFLFYSVVYLLITCMLLAISIFKKYDE